MPPALVIFDCDGVLVDSEPITNRVLAQDLTRHGLPLDTHECIELFVGGTMRGVFTRAREMGARLPETWVEDFYEIMITTLGREVEAIPGIHAVLDQLDAAGIAHCVASNGPMRKMAVTLGRTGLHDRLAGRLYSAHEVGIAKPDPGLFLHAAAAHDTRAGECVVIEDSASGARAAEAAGMRCFGFIRDTPAAKLAAHGAQPFADMALLPALLGLDS